MYMYIYIYRYIYIHVHVYIYIHIFIFIYIYIYIYIYIHIYIYIYICIHVFIYIYIYIYVYIHILITLFRGENPTLSFKYNHLRQVRAEFSVGSASKGKLYVLFATRRQVVSFCHPFWSFLGTFAAFFRLVKLTTNVCRLAHLRRCRQIKM